MLKYTLFWQYLNVRWIPLCHVLPARNTIRSTNTSIKPNKSLSSEQKNCCNCERPKRCQNIPGTAILFLIRLIKATMLLFIFLFFSIDLFHSSHIELKLKVNIYLLKQIKVVSSQSCEPTRKRAITWLYLSWMEQNLLLVSLLTPAFTRLLLVKTAAVKKFYCTVACLSFLGCILATWMEDCSRFIGLLERLQ